MAERELKRRGGERRGTEEVETRTDAPAGEATARGERLKAEMDELLDEIDEVLEDNAEEFVRNYVQKGGQ
jgi:ubiquitin-like protein Pup